MVCGSIIYKTLMSQVVAGKKFGGLNEVESVRFDLRKSEISELERMEMCIRDRSPGRKRNSDGGY